MKRLFLLLLVALCFAVVFASGAPEVQGAAKSGSLEPEEGAVIEFAYWESTTSIAETWTRLIAEFEQKYPGVKVNATVYPSKGFTTQIDTRMAANDYPDVCLVQYSNVGKYKDTGLMLDVSDYFSDEDIAGYVDGFVAPFLDGDAVYGVPLHTDTIVLCYNKTMFEEQGIRIPTGKDDAYTMEELEGIGKKLKEAYGLEYAFAGVWTGTRAMRLMPFAYELGVDIFPDNDFEKINIDTPEFKAFINLYKHWLEEGLVVAETISQKGTSNNMLMSGLVPFNFSGSWQADNIESGMPGNWGMTYLPSINGRLSSDLGGNGLFGISKTKYPNAVATFIKWLSSKEIMTSFCQDGGFIPVRKDIRNEDISYSKYDEELKIVIDFASTLDPKLAVAATSPNWSLFNTILSEEMDALVTENASAEDVISRILARWDEEL
ncbi:MAG: sugar ABC transporter substrate-binding protein [Spirochaetales bacterium]|nr:sugar ABC transporter substrate-binding protein [Spirochaetales bacterium]